MGLRYNDLTSNVRQLMLTEIGSDIAAKALYCSKNLSPLGLSQYPQLLEDAANKGDDDSLAAAVKPLLNEYEAPRELSPGRFSSPPRMRRNAHEMLAEGEFNRFYMRAVCVEAIANGQDTVEVYRAKEVREPRLDSASKIGTRVSAKALLSDLRKNIGIDTFLGLPSGPNSGLSVKL